MSGIDNVGNGAFCSTTAEVWQFIGRIVLILKIVIPIMLIVLGIIGLGKAVLADDDKEIKTQVNKLITKFIAAVVIFFYQTLLQHVSNLLTDLMKLKQTI